MKRKTICVTYDGSAGINKELDKKIIDSLMSAGFTWYGQGIDTVEPIKRNICFDII